MSTMSVAGTYQMEKYGAVELKKVYQRYLSIALGIAVAIHILVVGSYFLVQAAARQMRAQGQGGRVLLLSSVCGHLAIRSMAAYSMSKAALEMLARALVPELSPHRITINTVAPGATLTPRTLETDPHYDKTWGSKIPLGRAASGEDIASAALFLLSPAASHITGQSLVVDGGWTSVGDVPPGLS